MHTSKGLENRTASARHSRRTPSFPKYSYRPSAWRRFARCLSYGETQALLDGLAKEHWEDCGDNLPGFAIATFGLHMAWNANNTLHKEDVFDPSSILHNIDNVCDYLLFMDALNDHAKKTIVSIHEAILEFQKHHKAHRDSRLEGTSNSGASL
jgi:hypothetical protein